MGTAFLHGQGGGADSLNFIVRAYASADLLPEKAGENTIAVITETPMSSYVVSAEKPENLTAGMVWIRTANTSYDAFSITKKNPIYIYPDGCFQYDGEAWAIRTVYIRLDGEWVEWWNGQLYITGDEWKRVTKNWNSLALVPSSGASNTTVMMLYKESTYLWSDVRENTGSGAKARSTTVYCVNKIDLTKFSKLTFEGKFIRAGTTANGIVAACWENLMDCNYYTQNMAAYTKQTTASETLIEVDVSEVEGEHQVGIGLYNSRAEIEKCYLTYKIPG